MDIDWWLELGQRDESSIQIVRLNLMTANLRAESYELMPTVTQRHLVCIEKVMTLLQKALTLDAAYVSVMARLPAAWHFETVAWIDEIDQNDLPTSRVCPGRLDAYKEMWIGSVWNLLRASRLIVLGIVIRCAAWLCSPLDYRSSTEYLQAARTCTDLIADLVASVPSFLNNSAKNPGNGLNNTSRGSGTAIAGLFAIWPLFAASASDFATEAQRIWLKGRLRFIYEEMGIQMGQVMSEVGVTGLT